MARVLFTISIFIYLVFSNGWVLNVHYCMNKVSSVHLFDTKPEQCSKCGMDTDESNGCCHDEHQVVKLVQDQRPPVTLHYVLTVPSIIEADNTSFFTISSWHSEQRIVHVAHAPPRYPAQEIYLLHRVFRI